MVDSISGQNGIKYILENCNTLYDDSDYNDNYTIIKTNITTTIYLYYLIRLF